MNYSTMLPFPTGPHPRQNCLARTDLTGASRRFESRHEVREGMHRSQFSVSTPPRCMAVDWPFKIKKKHIVPLPKTEPQFLGGDSTETKNWNEKKTYGLDAPPTFQKKNLTFWVFGCLHLPTFPPFQNPTPPTLQQQPSNSPHTCGCGGGVLPPDTSLESPG